MRVAWTPSAVADVADQLDWVAERNVLAAIDLGDAVRTAVRRLEDFPTMGRPGRVRGTRELVVVGTPYVVVHRVDADQVVILRVLHGARRWPPVG